jgi:hypothetical protein
VFGEQAIEHITRLVTASLLQADQTGDGSVRFRMLVPLRQFGRDPFVRRGLLHAAPQCHAEHFVHLAEDAGLFAFATRPALAQRMTLELDNLRIACDWLVATTQTELAWRHRW